jgi:hypothetical protein
MILADLVRLGRGEQDRNIAAVHELCYQDFATAVNGADRAERWEVLPPCEVALRLV